MIGGSNIAAELAEIRPWSDRAAWITIEERLERLERARIEMARAGVDALVVGAGPSLSYFTGIGWSMIERLVALIVTPTGRPVIVCPTFEEGSLQAILSLDVDLRLWEEHEDPSVFVADVLRNGARQTSQLIRRYRSEWLNACG